MVHTNAYSIWKLHIRSRRHSPFDCMSKQARALALLSVKTNVIQDAMFLHVGQIAHPDP